MDSKTVYTFSKLVDDTKLCGVVHLLKRWVAIQRHLVRFERCP